MTATAISLAALIVSGVTLFWTMCWSVWQHRATTRPRVKVRIAIGMPVLDVPDGSRRLGDAGIDITAANDGVVPVTITGVLIGVRRDDRRLAPMIWVFQMPAPLPRTIGPGEHWNGMANYSDIREGLEKHFGGPRKWWRIRVFVRDPAGRDHVGKAKISGELS